MRWTIWQLSCGRAQQGDLDAFSDVVARFQRMALAVTYAMLGNRQLAEDAALA